MWQSGGSWYFKLLVCMGKEKKKLLLKAKASKLLLCNWGLNNGSFLFPEVKCILWWSLLTCFKKTFVHSAVDEEFELAFLFLLPPSSWSRRHEVYSHHVEAQGSRWPEQLAELSIQSQDVCPAALWLWDPQHTVSSRSSVNSNCCLVWDELQSVWWRGADPRHEAFKREQKRFRPCFYVFGDKWIVCLLKY